MRGFAHAFPFDVERPMSIATPARPPEVLIPCPVVNRTRLHISTSTARRRALTDPRYPKRICVSPPGSKKKRYAHTESSVDQYIRALVSGVDAPRADVPRAKPKRKAF